MAAGDRRVGLASSSTRAFIDRVLQTLGIAERFATIVSGDEVARGKPYPEIYRLAASRLEVAPQHCVAIEDTRLRQRRRVGWHDHDRPQPLQHCH